MIVREAVDININSPAMLYDLFCSIIEEGQEIDREKEHFWTVGLDSQNSIKFIDLVTLGDLFSAAVCQRQAFRLATARACAGVIFVHNHPSGVTTPSGEDLKITDQLVKAGETLGIKVHDHVIIGNGYWSIMNKCGKKDPAAQGKSTERGITSLDLDSLGAGEQGQCAKDAGKQPMKDMFVNKTIFYRQIDDLLKEALRHVSYASGWSEDIHKSRWADASLRKTADHIKNNCKWAEEAFEKIYVILKEQKGAPRAPKLNKELNCLERLVVIRGGNYQPKAADV